MMSGPLSRLLWNFYKQNQTRNSRLLLAAYQNRHLDYRTFTGQQKNSGNFRKVLSNVLTCAVLASGLGYLFYKRKDDFYERISAGKLGMPTVQALSIPPRDIADNRNKYNFIADVVEISAPSVVYIEIVDKRKVDLFTGRGIPASNGSGFIVAEDGLILTNAHVVINKPHTTVKVRLYDGTTYTGVVEDVDMHSDLATVRINKNKLPVMRLGSSSNVRPGEFVVAIGSPLSLSNTITSGVISSVHRPSEELGLFHKQMTYIQTDAAITFGNSGGPLVNLNGEAIGINSMKVTAGISFAIPIDYAKGFLDKAMKRRKGKDSGTEDIKEGHKRRYIGITMVTLTPDLLYEIQRKSGSAPLYVTHGVLVYKVVVGSPAHVGGLQVGDIITHVNGEPVFSAATVYESLGKPGKITFGVMRNGLMLYLDVNPEDV